LGRTPLPRSRRKPKTAAPWAAYALVGRRPFEDARWLLRWMRLKELLRLKLAR